MGGIGVDVGGIEVAVGGIGVKVGGICEGVGGKLVEVDGRKVEVTVGSTCHALQPDEINTIIIKPYTKLKGLWLLISCLKTERDAITDLNKVSTPYTPYWIKERNGRQPIT